MPRAVEIAVSEGCILNLSKTNQVCESHNADLTLSEQRTIRLIGTSVGGGAVEVKVSGGGWLQDGSIRSASGLLEINGFSREMLLLYNLYIGVALPFQNNSGNDRR